MDQRVSALERNVEIIRYPVVRGGTVYEPVGSTTDFLDDIDPRDHDRARRDFLPIPASANREGYAGEWHGKYWASGLLDFDRVVDVCRREGIEGGRYYDFGGSTGRVFRNFFCQERRFEIWSSDFKTASHQWNQRHMPSDIRVFLNGVTPPLPIADSQFDLVTAFSVFTHIDELETPWLLELHRILKPEGLLYVTIHDESQWEFKSAAVLDMINRSPNGAHLTAESPFPAERTAFHYSEQGYYSCTVFHPIDYIHRQWGRFFDVVDVIPRHHGEQSVLLLRRR